VSLNPSTKTVGSPLTGTQGANGRLFNPTLFSLFFRLQFQPRSPTHAGFSTAPTGT